MRTSKEKASYMAIRPSHPHSVCARTFGDPRYGLHENLTTDSELRTSQDVHHSFADTEVPSSPDFSYLTAVCCLSKFRSRDLFGGASYAREWNPN